MPGHVRQSKMPLPECGIQNSPIGSHVQLKREALIESIAADVKDPTYTVYRISTEYQR